MREARGDLECEVLQFGVEEEVEVVKPCGCLDAPDERGEVGKDVGARAVFLDDRENGRRNAFGAFVVCEAPDALTILNDLLPVFWGRWLSLCSRVR